MAGKRYDCIKRTMFCNYLIFLDGGKLVWSSGRSEAIMEKVQAFFVVRERG
ncbi:hypothetical protein ACFGOO_08275 [Treponema vincentii]|uniref:hypothetical protein n=1 Tax=Treponema vincentii TaxID=69710 RepID=UPI0035F55011